MTTQQDKLVDFVHAHAFTVEADGAMSPPMRIPETFSAVPVTELETFLAGWVAASVTYELIAQAEALERQVQYHGLGPHGPCVRCETRTLIAGDLRRRARAVPDWQELQRKDEVLTDLS